MYVGFIGTFLFCLTINIGLPKVYPEYCIFGLISTVLSVVLTVVTGDCRWRVCPHRDVLWFRQHRPQRDRPGDHQEQQPPTLRAILPPDSLFDISTFFPTFISVQ